MFEFFDGPLAPVNIVSPQIAMLVAPEKFSVFRFVHLERLLAEQGSNESGFPDAAFSNDLQQRT